VNNTTGFDSQFNEDSSGWQPYLGSWTIHSSEWYTSPIAANTWPSTSFAANFSNFQYEVGLWRSGCPWCANSIWVRGTPTPLQYVGEGAGNWNSGYLFEYDALGQFSVWREYPGGYNALQTWTYSPAINQGGAWNTLRVAANGSYLSFYINDELVWFGIDTSYSSGQVGITAWGNGSAGDQLWVDYAVLNVGSFFMTDSVGYEQRMLNDQAMQSGSHCMNISRQ
jgi:hypothetical protein